MTSLGHLCTDGKTNDFLFCFKDPALTKYAGDTPGIPVLYVHQKSIILDKMSKASSEVVRAATQVCYLN